MPVSITTTCENRYLGDLLHLHGRDRMVQLAPENLRRRKALREKLQ